MYKVAITNDNEKKTIHGARHKLSSGSVVQGINSINSFAFSVTPKNPAFDSLHDFTTLVEVYNDRRDRYEFQGRVLCSTPSMSESGQIKKDVTCESFFGFLCDSQQEYVEERNWTVHDLWFYIIGTHNIQVEDYKKFKLGDTILNNNDNVYVGIQRENTWDTIKKKLLDTVGGEIYFQVVNGETYIDHVEKIGEEKNTEIALSRNMKSITKEKDPSAYITRLIPLGCKLGETENRLDISEVNNGKNYIDDEQAMNEYGIHVGYVEFDDVTEPANLLRKGQEWLENNNKVLIKYSITALDLSLLGLDINDFEVHNYYPIKNRLLGIDDVARVTKKTIDICDETKTSIEIGESFKTLSELQQEQYNSLGKVNADIAEIKSNYALNETLKNEITRTQSLISQSEEEIVLAVSGGIVSADDYDTFLEAANAAFALKVGIDENDRIVSMLEASAEIINIKSNRLSIESDNFTLSTNGTITAKNANIEGTITAKVGSIGEWTITSDGIKKSYTAGSDEYEVIISAGLYQNNVNTSTSFYISKNGNTRFYIRPTGEFGSEGDNGKLTIDNGLMKINNTLGNMTLNSSFLQFYEDDKNSVIAFNNSGFGLLIQSTHSIGIGKSGVTSTLIGTWEFSSGATVLSDRNYKNTISNLSEKYSVFFDNLRPVTHKYNDGTSDRLHSGFIAQEVDEALTTAGLTRQDFAGLCIQDEGLESERWALRYNEFISLNTYEIQKLKKEVAELKAKIEG